MILGIDYGKVWCGLVTSEGSLAEPLKAVSLKNIFEEAERLSLEKIAHPPGR